MAARIRARSDSLPSLPRRFAATLPAAALFCGALFFTGASVSAQPAGARSAAFAKVDERLAELARISGLRARRTIRFELMDKARLKPFLEKRVREQVKPEDLRAEQSTLEMFGLVPPGFDLARNMIDLISEQAAAFYDYRRQVLVLFDGPQDAAQDLTLVHELAHALADQHFRLERYLKGALETDDSSLARECVMEGQANWLAFEWLANQRGRSLRDSPDLLERFAGNMDANSGDYPVLQSAPLYLQRSLLFPYSGGMRFQQALIARFGNDAFLRVFRQPPLSSQHILHPETYLEGLRPAVPPLPKRAKPEGRWRTLAEGSVGEFDHLVLLEQYAGKERSRTLAPEWRGGTFVLLEPKARGPGAVRPVLLYASEWRTEAAAHDWFSAFEAILEAKAGPVRWTRRDQTVLEGSNRQGHFRAVLSGRLFQSIEGEAEPVSDPSIRVN